MFEIKLIFYGLSRILQFSEFVWPLSYWIWDFFNNFLLIDTTDRSKISSDQKRFFITLSLYPLSFFTNTPFKQIDFLGYWVFSTNTDFLIPISLQDNVVDLRYLKLGILLDLIIKFWNIMNLHHQASIHSLLFWK